MGAWHQWQDDRNAARRIIGAPAFSFCLGSAAVEVRERADLYALLSALTLPWLVIAYGVWQLAQPVLP